MGLKATVYGEFLEAGELKPWTMTREDGSTMEGKTFSISLLQDSDSIRMNADQKLFNEAQALKRMDRVGLEIDLYRDRSSGLYKPKVERIIRETK